jgi:ribosome-associated protein
MELVAAKKASHITLLDLRGVSIIADYFLICSGESERQLKAIADEVEGKLGSQGVSPRRVEGTAESGWILLDFGAVILHVFDVTRRNYYQLEEVWKQARTLAVMP